MKHMRENLLDRLIKIYGFEQPIVIEFAKLCERMENIAIYDKALRVLVESHEEYPVLDTDEMEMED